MYYSLTKQQAHQSIEKRVKRYWCMRTCSVVYSHAVSPVRASVSHDDRRAAKMEWDRATSTQARVSRSTRKARVGCEAHGFQCTRIGANGQAATKRNRSTVQTCTAAGEGEGERDEGVNII